MKKHFLLIALSIFVVSAIVVSADSKQDSKQSKSHVNSSVVAYNNLSIAIDYWHDASLKGNKSAVAEYKQMVYQIINDDIKSVHQAISYAKLDVSYVKNEEKNKDNKSKLQVEESNFKAKKLLFSSIKKSKSFGYTYRLLADYLQLLDKEISENKIEIAEDVSGASESAGQIRRIK